MIFLHHMLSITPGAAVYGRARVYPFLPPAVWTCTVWSIQYLSTVIKCFKCRTVRHPVSPVLQITKMLKNADAGNSTVPERSEY
jgi:hypothetical protein